MPLQKTFLNPFTGLEVIAFGYTDRIVKWDRVRKLCDFYVDCYLQKVPLNLRQQGAIRPFTCQLFSAEGAVFTQYFSDNVITTNGLITQMRAYVMRNIDGNDWSTSIIVME